MNNGQTMLLRRLSGVLIAGALGASLYASRADALVLERVTSRGYIMTDEVDADPEYAGRAPASNTQGILEFVGKVTEVIDAIPDAPHADYIALIQTQEERSSLAFYLGIRNTTRGIGEEDPLGSGRELFDLNNFARTTFPVTGFVFLNSIRYFTSAFTARATRYLVCPQEFGHRFGVFVKNPPFPTGVNMPTTDSGVPDGGAVLDGGSADGGDPDASALEEAGTPDAGMADVPPVNPPGPALAVDELLGRQRAHWSYFVNSGGSPMEGNVWEEVAPGTFETRSPTYKFSPVDRYLMGLIPPSSVPNFYVIAEANVGSNRVDRESPPEDFQTVRVTGRKITVSIEDIIAQNGPRVPGFNPSEPQEVRDLKVAWVMLVPRGPVTTRTVQDFDRAVDLCALGYKEAADDLSHLEALAPAPTVFPDAGNADAGREGGVSPDAGGEDSTHLGGGCACTTTPASGTSSRGGLALGVLGMFSAGLAWTRTRRRHART